MIPKVVFKYSWIYDQNWKKWIKLYRKIDKYPSTRKILNYIKKVEKLWRKDEKKIFAELSKISGLKWKSKIFYCYVVGRCIPFSDPLTLPVYEKHPDYFVDVLTHELIHQLFVEGGNLEKSKTAWSYIDRKYREESHTTKIHIPLYALHSHIYQKFYDERRLNRNIDFIKHLPDYKRSWDIVKKEGYQNIIQEFTKRIKVYKKNKKNKKNKAIFLEI